MKFINLEQGSDEWLEWRKAGVGGSEVSALVSTNPYIKGPNELYHSKVNTEEDKKEIAEQAQAHGDFAEEEGLKAASAHLNTIFKPICVIDEEEPYLKVSLDGWSEAEGILECKAVSETVFDAINSDGERSIPAHIYDQLQYQMLVCQREYAWLYCQQNKTGKRSLLKVLKNELRQHVLKQKVLEFKNNIEKKLEPELGPNEFMDLSNTAFEAQMSNIKEHKERIKDFENRAKALKERLDKLVAEVTSEIGRGNLKCRDVHITQVQRKGSIDYKKLSKDYEISNIDYYRKKGSSYYRVKI